MRKKAIVDLETGESQRQRRKQFVIAYQAIWRALMDARFFTDKELVCLQKLSLHLSYDNAVSDRSGPLNVSSMALAVDMDKGNFSRLLKALMHKNAIGLFASGQRVTYYMNPELYCKGEPKPWLIDQFKHESVLRADEGESLFFVRGNRTTLVVSKR